MLENRMMLFAAQKPFWLANLRLTLEYKREKFVSFSLRSNSPREDTTVDAWRADFREAEALSCLMAAGTITKTNAFVDSAKKSHYQKLLGFYQEFVGRFSPTVDFSAFYPYLHLCVEETGVDSCRVATCRMDCFRGDQSCLEDTSQGSFSRFLAVSSNATAISVNAAFA